MRSSLSFVRRFSTLREVAAVLVLPLVLGSGSPTKTTNSPTHAPGTGAIHGKVLFKGARPKLSEAKCISPEVCGTTHSYDRLVLGKDAGVQYTLLYLQN